MRAGALACAAMVAPCTRRSARRRISAEVGGVLGRCWRGGSTAEACSHVQGEKVHVSLCWEGKGQRQHRRHDGMPTGHLQPFSCAALASLDSVHPVVGVRLGILTCCSDRDALPRPGSTRAQPDLTPYRVHRRRHLAAGRHLPHSASPRVPRLGRVCHRRWSSRLASDSRSYVHQNIKVAIREPQRPRGDTCAASEQLWLWWPRVRA